MDVKKSVISKRSVLRRLGLGLITGAADDDCSAIGTYSQAGAQLGYKALWTAPVIFPMMVTAVYLSGKLGQVTGQGLFGVLRSHYSRWFVSLVLVGAITGNMIEAGADMGGMTAAIGIFVPIPRWMILLLLATATLTLQIWGSYGIIRNIFRVLALSLLTYVISAFLAHPNLNEMIRGTFLPSLHFDKHTLSILVAIIGTSLSAYLYTWQSNEEVEEKEAADKHTMHDRRGTTQAELRGSLWDVMIGMLFSNLVMYFILLATAATLFAAGHHNINTASEAAQSLIPLAGRSAGLLFATGIIGVGFLAIPVMTTGAAYDVAQTLGWRNGLHCKPSEAKKFYAAIAIFNVIAVSLNFLGINPMRALVIAGIVQGFSTPPLMLLLMKMTNNRSIMGDKVNGRAINVLGWLTTTIIFLASAGLVSSWFLS
jgi:NRAMP (natural resistance-associated macrophage protein)-like metal ion transporter